MDRDKLGGCKECDDCPKFGNYIHDYLDVESKGELECSRTKNE